MGRAVVTRVFEFNGSLEQCYFIQAMSSVVQCYSGD